MNCIPHDDAHTEECIKGTNRCMKESFPEVAPVIEIFPGVHATLLADFTRYSNGKIPFGGLEMTVQEDGKPLGTIGCDGGGTWIFKAGQSTYSVNMIEAFQAVRNAHIASL